MKLRRKCKIGKRTKAPCYTRKELTRLVRILSQRISRLEIPQPPLRYLEPDRRPAILKPGGEARTFVEKTVRLIRSGDNGMWLCEYANGTRSWEAPSNLYRAAESGYTGD